MNCCANCNQGRKACPTPAACRLPDDPDEWEPVTGAELWSLMFWPGVCLAGVIAGAVVAFL